MTTQKERFLKYLQTCVKSTRATDANPLLLGGNAPKDYTRFLEADRLFDYNPSKWAHIGSMYDINDASKALDVFNALIADEDFLRRDKKDNQGWRKGAISHYVCFLNAQEFFTNIDGEQDASSSVIAPFSLPYQQITYGAPGTGKSHGTEENIKAIYPTKEERKDKVFRTTFHPDSDYSTFVGAYKPIKKKRNVWVEDKIQAGRVVFPIDPDTEKVYKEEVITYDFVPQAFTKAYISAWKEYLTGEKKPVFLVVEEINRGNCAQIFGDLFQLLDREDNGFSSYPIKPDTDLGNFIAEQLGDIESDEFANIVSGEEMLLPPNLYIWATMNTSDQSLFPIDSAFKRRWDWKYVPIDTQKECWSIKANGKFYDWSAFLDKINAEIDEITSSEDKMLGFYFCKADSKVISADKFVGKVIFYLWNDVFKDYGFDKPIFDDEDGKLSFRKFYNNDGTINEDKVELFLKNLHLDEVNDRKTLSDVDDIESDTIDAGKKEHKETLVAVTIDGERLTSDGSTQFDLYINAIKKLGVTKIAPLIESMKYRRKGSPMATTTQVQGVLDSDSYSYVEIDGYYFVKGADGYTLVRILEDLSKILNQDFQIEYK